MRKGQSLLSNKHYIESVEELNLSIQLMDESELENIGWIAAFRSSACFEMNLIHETISDCKLALENLPKEKIIQRFKIWERLALSTSSVGSQAALLQILRSIKSELEDSEMEKSKIVSLLERLATNLRSQKPSSRCRLKNDEEKNERNDEDGEERRPGDCVEVRVGEAGRYVVATRDIQAGELILKDPSTAAVLNIQYIRTNCSNCLKPAIAGVPCSTCSQVIFCSVSCRANANFHALECKYIHIYPTIGPLAPILRLFTSKSFEYFKENSALFQSYDPTTDWNLEQDLRCVFNLQRREKGSQYILEMTVQAYYVLDCLRRMGFFGEKSSDEDELYIGRLAYCFLLGVEENSHQIVEYQNHTGYTGSFDSLFDSEDLIAVIGSGVTRYTSLFNNSCDVNTIKYHQGKSTVLRAKRLIRKGEEVSDFYGEHFFNTERKIRRDRLGFQCICTPCRENWGLMKKLPSFTETNKTKIKKNWAQERRHLTSALARMDVESIKDSSLKLGKLAGVSPPHQDLVVPEMYLNYSLCYLYGNKSLRFLQFSKTV
ncbi:SET and MYND domain-containing protein 4 [Eurytemora carolleeae]|uniref:SET and MYND domain-containing protein 4 n=1 Tax=Eurytemora carolleeae TaxID=1294199 RepID=UPI000C793E92|nr:SET and MYND domain-containing protein 4 [Eurytemora carolleeae]|eukprot:XP_023325978.1 SET and MYND domain-containing protein 4-like [Eurytemora affinis]